MREMNNIKIIGVDQAAQPRATNAPVPPVLGITAEPDVDWYFLGG
jgi:hypothetical protein